MQNEKAAYDLEDLKKSVIRTVCCAANLIKDTPFTVTEKDKPANIVTTSDIKSQRYLIDKLSRLIPESGFFCEEEDLRDTDGEYIWVIDPIDGTANYARGIADCAISVALIHRGRAVLGVVCGIFTGDVFSATRGGGATLNGKPISVSKSYFKNGILCTAMSLYKKELAKVCSDIIYEAYMECNDVRRFGSCAMELCYLAAGRCELYFEIRVFPWDYAAGYLILEEAGGILRGLSDSELDFNRPTVLVGANNVENYEKLSQIVNKHLQNTPYED